MTVFEAAALLGVTVQLVHQACRVGRIRFELVKGVRKLQRDGLERRWWGSSQRLADRPSPPPPQLPRCHNCGAEIAGGF